MQCSLFTTKCGTRSSAGTTYSGSAGVYQRWSMTNGVAGCTCRLTSGALVRCFQFCLLAILFLTRFEVMSGEVAHNLCLRIPCYAPNASNRGERTNFRDENRASLTNSCICGPDCHCGNYITQVGRLTGLVPSQQHISEGPRSIRPEREKSCDLVKRDIHRLIRLQQARLTALRSVGPLDSIPRFAGRTLTHTEPKPPYRGHTHELSLPRSESLPPARSLSLPHLAVSSPPSQLFSW